MCSLCLGEKLHFEFCSLLLFPSAFSLANKIERHSCRISVVVSYRLFLTISGWLWFSRISDRRSLSQLLMDILRIEFRTLCWNSIMQLHKWCNFWKQIVIRNLFRHLLHTKVCDSIWKWCLQRFLNLKQFTSTSYAFVLSLIYYTFQRNELLT